MGAFKPFLPPQDVFDHSVFAPARIVRLRPARVSRTTKCRCMTISSCAQLRPETSIPQETRYLPREHKPSRDRHKPPWPHQQRLRAEAKQEQTHDSARSARTMSGSNLCLLSRFSEHRRASAQPDCRCQEGRQRS